MAFTDLIAEQAKSAADKFPPGVAIAVMILTSALSFAIDIRDDIQQSILVDQAVVEELAEIKELLQEDNETTEEIPTAASQAATDGIGGGGDDSLRQPSHTSRFHAECGANRDGSITCTY